MKHEIIRVRHELRRRDLEVSRVEYPTPGMLRMTLTGEELEGFHSPSADDHVKLFIPQPDGEPAMRDYTPRRYDAQTQSLVLDFALHDGGPATLWARSAKEGDRLQIGGPRGSSIVPHDFDWWLMVGDETALPAIGRRLEEFAPGTPVTTLVAVEGPAEEQALATRAAHRPLWVHRPLAAASDPAPVLQALADLSLPEGEGFVWIAAESRVAKAVRAHVTDVWGHPKQWLKSSGYWKLGTKDSHEEFDD
ncbi:siderophore-interacting protein [Aurantimonas sp. DM33-3]|uniref:siderophore-interacting protein n=1 Tax=Aurantimonas sp. DM33-3 TaxID=2766955 RepID=UPI001651FA30|nr:siderophore-interacting protein [Aurantimonas sp. DM33-3]MBC6716331.1 siderophore-interacting protein [Aurantimonas sp. DM33-3]